MGRAVHAEMGRRQRFPRLHADAQEGYGVTCSRTALRLLGNSNVVQFKAALCTSNSRWYKNAGLCACQHGATSKGKQRPPNLAAVAAHLS